jgi:hypothetical protein
MLDNDAVRRLLALDDLLPAIEQALIELSAGARDATACAPSSNWPNRAACSSSSRHWSAMPWRPS